MTGVTDQNNEVSGSTSFADDLFQIRETKGFDSAV